MHISKDSRVSIKQQFSLDEDKPVNQILAALPQSERDRLPLKKVSLSLGQILYNAGDLITDVYFPNQAMISLVSTLEDGSTTEIGMIGKEGMLGLPLIWGDNQIRVEAVVQIEDSAMKLDAKVLKAEFEWGGELQRQILLYTAVAFGMVQQIAVCNCHHTIEERFARWLLLVQDCVEKNEFRLTHELIANLLGTRRSGVTIAARTLSQAGMIYYSRGRITILNREDLEATTCECYYQIKEQRDRLSINQERGI